MLSIGTMTGTSMDGIDVALLETDGEAEIRALAHYHLAYDNGFKTLLKASEYAVRQTAGDMATTAKNFPALLQEYARMCSIDLATLTFSEPSLAQVIAHSTHLHYLAIAQLLQKNNYSPQQIDVIGYHGQTLYHQPERGISIIIGDGALLAEKLGITVVNNFREKDIAAGGQGAPFAPLYHLALAKRDKKLPLVVVNCGGIANATIINTDDPADLIAFDTGPGAGLIAQWARKISQGQQDMDVDGAYGQQGRVDENVLAALYANAVEKNGQNYFNMPTPKSLDSGDLKLIPELDTLSTADAFRTLAAFTADSVINAVMRTTQQQTPKYWILAGGGWHNAALLQELQQRLSSSEIHIEMADQAGWHSQALEAQIFAYFAVRSLHGKPLSVPGTTGVSKPITGGDTYVPS